MADPGLCIKVMPMTSIMNLFPRNIGFTENYTPSAKNWGTRLGSMKQFHNIIQVKFEWKYEGRCTDKVQGVLRGEQS